MIREFIETDCAADIGLDKLRRAIERETDRLEHVRDPFLLVGSRSKAAWPT